jgi:ATP-dependent Clp protease ATP-binding subunit ClpA
MINDLKVELLLKQGIDLEISLKALAEIVRLGTDPIFGARPLQRKINEIIKAEIANLILANKISRGQKIFIDCEENFEFQII